MLMPGDIVTVNRPYGDGVTQFVVARTINGSTAQIVMGGELFAYGEPLLTVIGSGGEIPPYVAPTNVIRDWEFRNRFTQPQLVGIMRAGMAGDDIAALLWLQLCTASDGVDLNDPANIGGVQYIASAYPDLNINPVEVLA